MPNDTLIHADIFFFVSTIALIIVSIGIIYVVYYVVRILRNVKEITDKMRIESGAIVDDVRRLRASLRDEGLKWKHVADLARGFFIRKSKKAKKLTDTIIK